MSKSNIHTRKVPPYYQECDLHCGGNVYCRLLSPSQSHTNTLVIRRQQTWSRYIQTLAIWCNVIPDVDNMISGDNMMTASLPGPELQAGHQQPAGSAERGQPLGQQLPQQNITVTIYTIYTLLWWQPSSVADSTKLTNVLIPSFFCSSAECCSFVAANWKSCLCSHAEVCQCQHNI